MITNNLGSGWESGVGGRCGRSDVGDPGEWDFCLQSSHNSLHLCKI
jgi:hypothetical protein